MGLTLQSSHRLVSSHTIREIMELEELTASGYTSSLVLKCIIKDSPNLLTFRPKVPFQAALTKSQLREVTPQKISC